MKRDLSPSVERKLVKRRIMTRNTSVVLGDHFANFIDAQVGEGRYGSASDVVRAGLRLLEEREAKVKSLQDALIVGEQSGKPKPFDFDAFIARKTAEAHPRRTKAALSGS